MKNKKRLGKGLGALIPSFDTSLNEAVIDGTILIKKALPHCINNISQLKAGEI